MADISVLYSSVAGSGGAAVVISDAPPASAFTNVTEGGSSRLVYTDVDLASRVNVGDTIDIDLDGTVTSVTIRSRNTATGAVTFEESTPTLTSITGATTRSVSIPAREGTTADRILRYTSDTDTTGESTKVVYLTETEYEAITTPDPNTLYLIRD